MKRIVFLLAIALTLCSCGPSLKEDGSFGDENFVGKFHGVTVYSVTTPGGTVLYIGIDESGKAVSTQYTTGGKTPTTHRVIVIDGKNVTEEEAKKLLNTDSN